MTMSEKARAIADRPAFPLAVMGGTLEAAQWTQATGSWQPGMTYHQWLVGQALAGFTARDANDVWSGDPVFIADAVCEALAEREL